MQTIRTTRDKHLNVVASWAYWRFDSDLALVGWLIDVHVAIRSGWEKWLVLLIRRMSKAVSSKLRYLVM